MADETKTYLLNVKSNLEPLVDDAVKAKKAMDEFKASLEALKKEGKEGTAEFEAMKAALKNSQDEYRKATKLVTLQVSANNSETNSRKQLAAVLEIEMQKRGKLVDGLVRNKDGILVVNKAYIENEKKIAATKQAMIEYDQALNDGRSNIGRYGTAMGRYGKTVVSAFDEIGGAVGGVVGTITSGISSIVSGAGPLAMLAAAIALIAKLWKNAKENIDLYLKSADKLKYGLAGYEAEADKARIETRKRAQGQINEGYRITEEYERKIFYNFGRFTEDQLKSFRIMVETGKEMVKNGKILRDQVRGSQDKTEWELQYNKLLQDQESLMHRAMENAIKWEGMEAEIVRLKGIFVDKSNTDIQRANAKNKIEQIANLLLVEKGQLLDDQITNLDLISKMTGTEEVAEDKIRAIQKEKNTLIKEYQTDLFKVLKMENQIGKNDAAELAAIEKLVNEETKLIEDRAKKRDKEERDGFDRFIAYWNRVDAETAKRQADEIQAGFEYQNIKAEGNLDMLDTLLDQEYGYWLTSAEYAQMGTNQKLLADQQYTEAKKRLSELRIEQERSEYAATANVLGGLSDLMGRQTEAGKGFAIAQATINTWVGVTEVLAEKGISTYMKFIKIAAVIIEGLAAVRNITAVDTSGSSRGVSAPTAISSSATAQRAMAAPAGSTVFTQPQLTQTQLNALPSAGSLTAEDIRNIVRNMPAQIVTVEDFNVKVKAMKKIEVRATI
jgi:hypothetical protein